MSDQGLVLHAKFAAYLGWSQPFLHRLITGLEAEQPGAVLCNRRENADRFPLPRYVCTTTQALIRPAGAGILAELLRAHWAPRLLHAHFGWSGIRSLLVRQCLGVPLVTTFGGRDLGADLHDPLQRPLYRRLLDASDLCLCVSDTLASILVEEGVESERIRVVRRGTDVDVFAVQDRAGRSQTEPIRLLMVGRLVEKKGHADALVGLAALRDAGIRGQLRIVGAGKGAQVLEQARKMNLADQVEVIAPTDTAGVLDHFRWADLLLHPSRTGADGDVEGIPNVVVEAAATGLAVLGTHHGGIPEVVVEGETGRLVAEHDAKALAEALVDLAGDPARRRAWGEAGARRVRALFTMETQLRGHTDAYRSLAGSHPRAQPLGPDYTRDALTAIAPAIDADLLVASRWAKRHWEAPHPEEASVAARSELPATPGSSAAVQVEHRGNAPFSPIQGKSSATPKAPSLRERIRELGAAWAEKPVLGVPMRAYRGVRRGFVAAAQNREDGRAWDALGAGRRLRFDLREARSVLKRVVKEGPAGDAPAD